MTPRVTQELALTFGTLAIILAVALPAGAQAKLPESAFISSHEPAVISRQLRLAQQLGRKALAGLEATSSDDAIPIDPNVIQAARETYGLIRSARHGMELAQQATKYPDPLIGVMFPRVTQAWDLSRIPVDKYSWGIPRQAYLDVSIPALRQSMRLLDQVVVMMPWP